MLTTNGCLRSRKSGHNPGVLLSGESNKRNDTAERYKAAKASLNCSPAVPNPFKCLLEQCQRAPDYDC